MTELTNQSVRLDSQEEAAEQMTKKVANEFASQIEYRRPTFSPVKNSKLKEISSVSEESEIVSPQKVTLTIKEQSS